MKKRISSLMAGLAVCACVHLAGPALQAQVGTQGAIVGECKDASGAVVPRARVTITNLDTGIAQTHETNAEGYFEINQLPIGFYSVSVVQKGFRPWILERTELTVGERKTVSPVLEVGSVEEKVNVTAALELVQTEQASINKLIQETQIDEMPLLNRNVGQLAILAPGVEFTYNRNSFDLTSDISGSGERWDQTNWKIDGVDSNSSIYEEGWAIPSVEDVSEFSVKTADFGAEYGRDPGTVIISTNSGNNRFRGVAYDFLQNTDLNARNAFALTVPEYIRNQFGAAGGGPIIKDRTFFFFSYQGTRIRQQSVFDTPTINPAFLTGDFSSVSKQLVNPVTGAAYPNNYINPNTFSPASTFFFPNTNGVPGVAYVLLPNSPGDLYRATEGTSDGQNEWSARIDHNISDRQRIYARYWNLLDETLVPEFNAQQFESQGTRQDQGSLNYNFSITPDTLLSVTLGATGSFVHHTSPGVGQVNLTDEAGISGFSTPGREEWIGAPYMTLSGYNTFGQPEQTPYHVWGTTEDGTVAVNMVRGTHSIYTGVQYDDRQTEGHHGSIGSRGYFAFNGQYTGNSFADYVLGYSDSSYRNYPIDTFGMKRSPYTGFYVQDYWKLRPNLTLNLGLRLDRWYDKTFVRGAGVTFDPSIGKAIAGQTSQGKVDLTAQSEAPALAASAAGYWESASQVGYPNGLLFPNNNLSPRVGFAWQPPGKSGLVVRGAFGIFASMWSGNETASAVVGPPYWSYENITQSATQVIPWTTMWPASATNFVASSISAADPHSHAMRDLEWNLTVQKTLPGKSALTLSYVGNHASDLISYDAINVPVPGSYSNIQAASPWPFFGSIWLYQNAADGSYNGLQAKWERRFEHKLSFDVAYCYSKTMGLNGPDSLTGNPPVPYAPAGYLYGRSAADITNVFTAEGVWGLPFGAGGRFGANVGPALNTIIGGWQAVPLITFASGAPINFDSPGATLGNGYDTRPNVAPGMSLGSLRVANPSAAEWFNPSALSAPPAHTFGDVGLNAFDGPPTQSVSMALMKDFHFFSEHRYLQFRCESYNLFNRVNLAAPNASIGESTTGKILSAGAARQIQFALKLYF